MPFLRFSRDRRGYEHFYLVQQTSGRRGKSRPRILFWFRTPPNIKVGREPFAEHVKRALEAQHPGVSFDWTKLMATPIPPPEAERWRERRRAERAARQTSEAEVVEGSPLEDNDDVRRVDLAMPIADVIEEAPEVPATSGNDIGPRVENHAGTHPAEAGSHAAEAGSHAAEAGPHVREDQRHPRRRRRRRRRGRRPGPSQAQAPLGPASPNEESQEGAGSPPGPASPGKPGSNEEV